MAVVWGLATATAAADGASPGRTALRSHVKVLTSGGESLTATCLSEPRGTNPETRVSSQKTVLLLDGASLGRWVFEAAIEGSADPSRLAATYTLRPAEGQKSLEVTYLSGPSEGQGEYRLDFSGKEIAQPESQIPPSFGAQRAPLWSELPESLQRVLPLLRDLMLDNPWWGPDEIFLAPFFGMEVATGEGGKVTVESLPVDCSFDASFGFPCLPDEEPRVGGKVLVRPLD